MLDYGVIDSPPEPNFDRITQTAAMIFHTPIATIALLDRQRYWLKSKLGVTATEMSRRSSFCDFTVEQKHVFAVADAQCDVRFVAAPLVVEPPHIRWYAGAPLITPSGVAVGSLCVLDTVARPAPNEEQAAILLNLAGTVVELLEARSHHRQLAERTAEATRLAALDPLTGLANRRALRDRLAYAIAGATPDRQAALLCVDLDEFKRVNDTMGHPAGDRLLQLVADRLRRAVPQEDFVARFGGDEFAIVLRDLRDPRRAVDTAERVVAQMNLPFRVEGRPVRIGACVGVALAADATVTADSMLREADGALYRAKHDGRSGIHLFMPEPLPIAVAS